MQTEEIIHYANKHITDLDYFIWYLLYCYAFEETKGTATESHHILPKNKFPEFIKIKDAPWNRANLSQFNHYIAHYILAKAMSQPSTIAAFNLMGRCAKTESELIIKANLYSEFRNQIAINNSLRNKGRKLTASQLEKMSTHMKNKVIVHYPDSDTNFQIDRDDLRYLNGDVILCQVGRIHTDKTKQKMSDNGIKDCIQIYNISKPDKTRFIPNTEDIPQGFDIGNPSHSSIAVERFTGAHHFYNPTTKESKRFKVTENIPDGFIQTRDGYDNPWKGVVIYKNWVTNQTETHPKLDELPFGVSENTCKHAFIFEGKITFSLQRLLRVHPDKFNNSVIQKLIRLDAPKKIFSYKVSPCIRNYIQTFEFYNDIPLVILPIYEVVDKITPENWL